MLRILHIQPVAERGGSDRALVEVVRSLPAGRFESHVVTPDEPPLRAEFEAAGATVHVVPMKRITTSEVIAYWLGYALSWPVAVVRLVRLVRHLDIDVIHTNSLHSWYGWAVALVTRRPHVWSAREIVAQSNAALRLERFLTRHFATIVVAISHAVAAQLDARDVRVFAEEIDTIRFRPVRTGAFRAAHGIPDEAILFGAAGRIDTWKGFDVLLDAWAKAAREGMELVVAGGAVRGKEDKERELRDRAASLGVRWIGPVDDLATFYADLDAFVMPSTLPEPLGLVMLEALACGTPVIATNHGGPVEVIGGHPERGALVAPNDAAALAEVMGAFAPRTGDRVALFLLPPAPWAEVLTEAAAR